MRDKAQSIYKSIVVAQKFEAGTPGRTAIDRSYRETQQVLAIAATAGLAPMLLIMFALKNINLAKEEVDELSEVGNPIQRNPVAVLSAANLVRRGLPGATSKEARNNKKNP